MEDGMRGGNKAKKGMEADIALWSGEGDRNGLENGGTFASNDTYGL